MVQCHHCQEQVEPTPNQHCPKCDANLSVAMPPPAAEDNIEPFLGFRFYAITGVYFIGVLLMAIVGGIGQWKSPRDAFYTTLNNMFFMGLSLPFIQPVGGVVLLVLAGWIAFTKKRQTLIRCSIAYAVVMVVMIALTLYFFSHCGPACP